MTIPNPPIAIHAKTIELACDGDRIWFGPPYGTTWRVFVTRINSGVRTRLLVALPEGVSNDGVDDKRLSEIIRKATPPDVRKITKAMKKHWKEDHKLRPQAR